MTTRWGATNRMIKCIYLFQAFLYNNKVRPRDNPVPATPVIKAASLRSVFTLRPWSRMEIIHLIQLSFNLLKITSTYDGELVSSRIGWLAGMKGQRDCPIYRFWQWIKEPSDSSINLTKYLLPWTTTLSQLVRVATSANSRSLPNVLAFTNSPLKTVVAQAPCGLMPHRFAPCMRHPGSVYSPEQLKSRISINRNKYTFILADYFTKRFKAVPLAQIN